MSNDTTVTNTSDGWSVDRRTLMKKAGGVSVTALVGGFAGCAGNDTDPGSGDDLPQGSLLFTQVKGWAYQFDPIILNGVPSAQVADQIFEGLYHYNEDATGFTPVLADGEPEESEDGLTYTVDIKDEATFQNGETVTAEDVKYSFEAPVDEETENAAEVEMIESIDVVDEKQVRFNLSFPYGAFDVTLTWPIVHKASREEFRVDEEDAELPVDGFGYEPVGTGPFQFVEWEDGQYVLLERWDDYWGDQLPNLAEVEFDFVEEQTTRVTGLETGESDVIETIPPQLWDQVEGMDNASIESAIGIGYFYLAFNCLEGPTADPRVREAVDYAFSMDEAVASFVEPAGVRQYSPYPQSIVDRWDFPVDEWSQIPHDRDLDAAQQLFEDAGVDWSYEWRIIVPPDDMREQIGVSVSNGLKEVGFENVSMERLEWGTFLDLYVTGSEDDFNMYTLGWSGSPDPDTFAYYMFAQELEGVTNGSYYRNDEVDQLIMDARETPGFDERREMYIDATTTVLEDRPHLPAYNLKNSYGVANYVEDFVAHPISSIIPLSSEYTNVSVE